MAEESGADDALLRARRRRRRAFWLTLAVLALIPSWIALERLEAGQRLAMARVVDGAGGGGAGAAGGRPHRRLFHGFAGVGTPALRSERGGRTGGLPVGPEQEAAQAGESLEGPPPPSISDGAPQQLAALGDEAPKGIPGGLGTFANSFGGGGGGGGGGITGGGGTGTPTGPGTPVDPGQPVVDPTQPTDGGQPPVDPGQPPIITPDPPIEIPGGSGTGPGTDPQKPILPVDDGKGGEDNPPHGPANPAGVPEPGTWLLMILGFGSMGATLRRRRPAL